MDATDAMKQEQPEGLPSEERGAARCAPSAVPTDGPSHLTIARIVAPWGIRGELKARSETDYPDRFESLERVWIGPERIPHRLEGFRWHKGFLLLRIAGCGSRTDAERFRGLEVQVPVSQAVPLGPGEYYAHQIEGLEVRTEEGRRLGRIVEVLFTGSNPVYLVQGEREVLLPAIKDVVTSIDPEAGCMVVRPPPGLLD
jgi:16S rRNA processing protein RimM